MLRWIGGNRSNKPLIVLLHLKKRATTVFIFVLEVLLIVTCLMPYFKQKIKTKRSNNNNDDISNSPKSYHAQVDRGGVPKG